MKDIIIIGAGGFAREIAFLIEDINKEKETWNLLGYVSDDPEDEGKVINGYKVLGTTDYLDGIECYVTNTIGSSKIREQVNQRLEKYSLKYANLIHPNVVISSEVNLGQGVIICAGCIVTTNVDIGNHVILNLTTTLGHDVVLKDYVTILPGCNISGNVVLEKGTDVGTGTQIIPSVHVGENTIIGAGATVTKDLPANCTAVGVPAKPIKFHN